MKQKLFACFAIAALLLGMSACTTEDNPVPDTSISEKLLGKWMISELENQPCPTNLKAVITFLSATEAYGSLSDFYSESWNSHASATVVIDGTKVSLTANENEHIKHVTNVDISSITGTDMWLSSDWRVYEDGKEIIHETYDNEHYERITKDYEKDIIGTWEGKVTSTEDDHTDGELHRWEYKTVRKFWIIIDNSNNFFTMFNTKNYCFFNNTISRS